MLPSRSHRRCRRPPPPPRPPHPLAGRVDDRLRVYELPVPPAPRGPPRSLPRPSVSRRRRRSRNCTPGVFGHLLQRQFLRFRVEAATALAKPRVISVTLVSSSPLQGQYHAVIVIVDAATVAIPPKNAVASTTSVSAPCRAAAIARNRPATPPPHTSTSTAAADARLRLRKRHRLILTPASTRLSVHKLAQAHISDIVPSIQLHRHSGAPRTPCLCLSSCPSCLPRALRDESPFPHGCHRSPRRHRLLGQQPLSPSVAEERNCPAPVPAHQRATSVDVVVAPVRSHAAFDLEEQIVL